MKIMTRGPHNNKWKLAETAAYTNEKELQSLLVEAPELISISELREDAGSLVVAIREFILPIGFIDIIAFTAEGDIAVIECKLASSSEVKRKVIGQVLEYGANLWKLSYEELDAGVQQRTGQTLADLVESKVQNPDWDEENFRSNVEHALAEGHFILIIVVDQINEELTRIVHFLNYGVSQKFDFAALELRRFQQDTTELLIPRFFGPTQTIKTKSNRPDKGQWDEETFFVELNNRNDNDQTTFAVAKRLLEWNREKLELYWGQGTRNGSFVPICHHNGTKHQLFAVWTAGNIEFYFYWFAYKRPFDDEDKRLEIIRKLNQIENVAIPEDAVNKRPSIRLNSLASNEQLGQFLAVFDWVIEEIQKV